MISTRRLGPLLGFCHSICYAGEEMNLIGWIHDEDRGELTQKKIVNYDLAIGHTEMIERISFTLI